jgi:signal transduction histidine kinase
MDPPESPAEAASGDDQPPQAMPPLPAVPLLHRLGTRLTLTLIGVGMVPLLLFAGYTIITMHRMVTTSSQQVLAASTRDYADRVETWIRRGLDQVRMAARLPGLAALAAGDDSESLRAAVRADLSSLLQDSPVFIRSVALIDLSGRPILTVPEGRVVNADQGQEWFHIPLLTAEPTFRLSPAERNIGQLVFSAAIMRAGEPIAVIRIGYHLAALDQLFAQIEELTGTQSLAALLLDGGILLASNHAPQNPDSGQWIVGEPLPVPELVEQMANPATRYPVEVAFDHLGISRWTATLEAIEGAPWRLALFLSSEQFLAPARARISVALMITAVLILLLAALGYASVRAVSRNLHHLADATREIAIGRLDTQVSVESRDECGLLARSFNHMVRQLEQRTAALNRARHEAEAASRAKSEFLSMMSHEVRTPLNAVIGYSDLLVHDDGLSADHRGTVRTIRRSGRQLLDMLNNILDFTKLEAGKVELDSAPFPLLELFSDVIEQTAAEAIRKGLEIVLEPIGTLPVQIDADGPKLRQILLNLVFNALKFTETGGVHVLFQFDEAAERQTGSLLIMVEDTGIGISPEVRQRLFQPFSQGDSSTTRRHGGTGLGLVISRQIARACGGELIECSGRGSGACFNLSVPVRRCDADNLPAPEIVEAHRGMRICLLSRNSLSADFLRRQLESAGLICSEPPCNGAAALLIDQPPDPDQDFIDLASVETARADGVPVLVLHPALQRPIPARARNCSALSKPVLPHELLSRINPLLHGGECV